MKIIRKQISSSVEEKIFEKIKYISKKERRSMSNVCSTAIELGLQILMKKK